MAQRTGTYRREFQQALAVLARVFDRVVELGGSRPVIVGGASVEFYTVSDVRTGDVDIVTAADKQFEQAMREAGFRRPMGPGVLTRGWIHDDLGLGVEVVGSTLMDGAADRHRVRVVQIGAGHVSFLSLEDIIADRMGQYVSDRTHGADMIGQAKALLDLGGNVDEAYLDRRIREETTDGCSLETLRQWRGTP